MKINGKSKKKIGGKVAKKLNFCEKYSPEIFHLDVCSVLNLSQKQNT